MTLRYCRSRAIFTFGLAVYLATVWITSLAQSVSPSRQEFERQVVAAVRLEGITNDLKELRDTLKIMQDLKIDQRLTRIEEAQQRNLIQTEKTSRMVSGIMFCLMGFLLQQVWKMLTQRRVLEHSTPRQP